MRRTLVLALLLSACSPPVHDVGVSTAGASAGPDAILVRLPSDGGTAHAYRWGSDSALWTSAARVPRLARVLAFDDDQGSLAYVDGRGTPGRLDLRIGSAEPATTTAIRSLASDDGWAIYGLTSGREVSRLTPSGAWTFKPEREPQSLMPVADGSLILVSPEGRRLRLNRIHPPEPRVTDTASVPEATVQVQTALGDRVYFLGDSGLAGVRVRDLARTRTVRLPSAAADAVATPSGDRIFVALKGRKSIAVIDRYAETIERTIDLPTTATALRMDPDGRYVLARAGADSVRVIALGTARVISTLRSAWRDDLPLVGPDGSIALLQDADVVLVDAETRKQHVRFAGGMADLWTLVRWNGFRPRAAGLDEPVRFAADSDSVATQAAVDSGLAARVAPAPGAAPPDVRAPEPAAPPAAPAETPRGTGAPRRTFTLSFAAMLSEARANALAATIRVEGRPVRVVPETRDGVPIYRVVYGPFSSREEADRAGRQSGLPYWVFEGAP